jgi:hypothetical protein
MLIRAFFWCTILLLEASWSAFAQPQAPIKTTNASTLSDAKVRHFVSRAMTLQGFNGLAPAERQSLATWVGSVGTRFVGRVGGFWYTPENANQERALYDTLRHTVATLHRAQPALVVQGAIFEIIYAHAGNLPVPNAARAEFGEDTVALPHRNFRFASMMYPRYFSVVDSAHYRWDGRPPGQAPGIPDMSQLETQLWFYTIARRQIDAGCEAIHFGQVMSMDDRDPGHHAWWSLLQRVRTYARTRNRGFVLCDAHTHSEYYDPDPAHPLPTAQRQLLFNFHSFPLRNTEVDTLRHGQHGASLEYATPNQDQRGAAIYGKSGGGMAPNGKTCAHLPAIVEFDNGPRGIPWKPGQGSQGLVWGLDEISWFASQPLAYRNQWLVYAVARLQQLDPDCYLEMPGLRGVSVPPTTEWLYRADTAGQGETIKAIWNGKTKAEGRRMLLTGPTAR